MYLQPRVIRRLLWLSIVPVACSIQKKNGQKIGDSALSSRYSLLISPLVRKWCPTLCEKHRSFPWIHPSRLWAVLRYLHYGCPGGGFAFMVRWFRSVASEWMDWRSWPKVRKLDSTDLHELMSSRAQFVSWFVNSSPTAGECVSCIPFSSEGSIPSEPILTSVTASALLIFGCPRLINRLLRLVMTSAI